MRNMEINKRLHIRKETLSQIWVMDSDGSHPTQLTFGDEPGFPDANAPQWSRDGSRIAYWSGFERQYGEIWTMNPDGSEKTKISETADPFNSDNPSGSPDGGKILFTTTQTGAGELWIMDADGANPHPLVTRGRGRASWRAVSD